VAVFTINHTDGTLTPVSGSPFAIGGVYTYGAGQIVIGPSGQFLYIPYAYPVGGNPTFVVAAYSIDPTTGALTMVPGGPVPVDTGPRLPLSTRQGQLPVPRIALRQANRQHRQCGVLSTLAIDAISGALTVTGSNSECESGLTWPSTRAEI
jgi:hypothetical protein